MLTCFLWSSKIGHAPGTYVHVFRPQQGQSTDRIALEAPTNGTDICAESCYVAMGRGTKIDMLLQQFLSREVHPATESASPPMD